MVDAPLRDVPVEGRAGRRAVPAPQGAGARQLRLFHRVLIAGLVGFFGLGAVFEARSSLVQAIVVSALTRGMTFAAAPGPSPAIAFPVGGPYDERLGYARLPSFIERLTARHFAVVRQARLSPALARLVEEGGYAVYHEKPQAGLRLLDRSDTPIYAASYPKEAYADAAAVPPLVARTLMFIEDGDLLDRDQSLRNPAVDWKRFLLAAAGEAGSLVDRHLKQGGASTLATQIEKFRHSPAGRTGGVREKLRQMATATLRAYLDGPNTLAARRRILVTYLNATPLSSRPGYGEVIGVADGLLAWYGADFAADNRVLAAPAESGPALARKAEAYRRVLSLLLAERRPSYYLLADRAALGALTDHYLRLLAAARVIDGDLRDAALAAAPRFSAAPPAPRPVSFVGRKAADAVRTQLLGLLGVPNFYSLDRLDLTAATSLDAAAQARVAAVLARLGDPEAVHALGLVGHDLLGSADPARVAYSVVLYERGADRNVVRVHADSLDEPFDINSDAKLILGSTAKLRTLVTYLDIVADLHRRLAGADQEALRRAAAAGDPLTGWAATYLAGARNRSLAAMLDAALQRRYSASPGEAFFTGSGLHRFHNFEKSEDFEIPTVEDAFRRSINLAFIRIMRDIVRYERGEVAAEDGPADRVGPRREADLARFADEEGRRFLNRFFDDYRGRTPDEALTLLASRARPVPRRLAALFLGVRPRASRGELAAFLARRLPQAGLDDGAVAALDRDYGAGRWSLADRAYIAGVHPLELWLAGWLQDHPGATRGAMLAASAGARQDAYRWLFRTHSAYKQDWRIRILREEDAFGRILDDWRRQGYPFAHLVPSLASALGSSGDRPDALAHLMGIILNDGLELPTIDVARLDFAAGTPYETDLAAEPQRARRVLAPEIAAALRRALGGVVEQGTGQRVRGTYRAPDGAALAVGGKTGTGDNRYESVDAAGTVTASRPVDRTATFVFFLGPRFFGTITAYVRGEAAGDYHFTSALAVQLLKALAPELQPLIDRPAAAGAAG